MLVTAPLLSSVKFILEYYLSFKSASTFAAQDFATEWVPLAVLFGVCINHDVFYFSLLHDSLDTVSLFLCNNGFMVIGDVVALSLSPVSLSLEGHGICGKGLLKEHIADIFFISLCQVLHKK